MELKDYIELILMARDATLNNVMSGLAGMFAYLIACHFQGRNLSWSQHVLLAALYSLFTFLTIHGMHLNIDATYLLTEEMARAFPDHAYTTFRGGGIDWFRWFIPLFFIASWTLTVIYGLSSKNRSAGHDT